MTAVRPIATAETAVGFTAPEDGRLRFVAADRRLSEIDGTVFDSPAAAGRLAEAMLAAGDIAPSLPDGLATGGSAASRMLFALLNRHAHFQVWG